MSKMFWSAGLALTVAATGCVGAADVEEGDGLGAVEDEARPRRCGGVAGRSCPSGYTCEDDRSDRCDPRRGGADCPGVCRRARCDYRDPARRYVARSAEECSRIRYACVPGTTPFSDACGCGCQTAR